MTNEHLYKMLYEAVLQENKKLRQSTIDKYLEKAKKDLGQDYWDFKDTIVVESLKEIIESVEDTNLDIYETPANKAFSLSAAYAMLKYHLTRADYKEYATSRKLHKDITHD